MNTEFGRTEADSPRDLGAEGRNAATTLQSGELFNVRGHVYRVVGFNGYDQAMLEEIRWPTDAERMRAISTLDLLKVAEDTGKVMTGGLDG